MWRRQICYYRVSSFHNLNCRTQPPDFWGRVYGESVDTDHLIGAIVALSNMNAHYG